MMNDRYVTYVSYLKVSRMKYACVFFLRIFIYIYIRVYKLDPIETRFRVYLHRVPIKNSISDGISFTFTPFPPPVIRVYNFQRLWTKEK